MSHPKTNEPVPGQPWDGELEHQRPAPYREKNDLEEVLPEQPADNPVRNDKPFKITVER